VLGGELLGDTDRVLEPRRREGMISAPTSPAARALAEVFSGITQTMR